MTSSISDTDTTISVLDGTKFYSSGILQIDSEIITYSGIDNNTLTGVIRGAYLSTAISHDSGATVKGTYVGRKEQNPQADVIVSCKTNVSGTLYFDFSNDGFITDSTEKSTTFRIYTYFGVTRHPSAPLLQTLSDDSDSIVVRAVSVGRQPDGDYVNTPSDGVAWFSKTLLGPGEYVTSNWIETDGWNCIEIFVRTDVIGENNGIKIEYSNEVNVDNPEIMATVTYDFNSTDVLRGYKNLKLCPVLDGCRVTYINGSIAQSVFYIDITLKTNLNSAAYNDAQALLTSDFLNEVAFGNISKYKIDTKFGRVTNISSNSTPQDVWGGDGVYSGQPNLLSGNSNNLVQTLTNDSTNTTPFEPISIVAVSSSNLDKSDGSGARSIRIFGLKTDTSQNYESEDIVLNGKTNVNGTYTWWRINRAYVLTAGSDGENQGNITIKTSDNSVIFCVISPTYNQTTIAAYTVPYTKTALIKKIILKLVRSNAKDATATVSLRIKNYGGVYRSIMVYDLDNANYITDDKLGGIVCSSGSDIKFRVEDVSTSNVTINVQFEFILIG